MKIAFRADASAEIGTGHIMRCITLADAFKGTGGQCYFICRSIPQSLQDVIKSKGHSFFQLPHGPPFIAREDDVAHASWLGVNWEVDALHTAAVISGIEPDWIVLDHYALDHRWEKQVRGPQCKLIVIDDLFDRPHIADILLDQNLGRSRENYKDLVPRDCQVLAGPEFALLRPEFEKMRAISIERRKKPKLEKLLITMGGADKDNVSGWLIDFFEEATDLGLLSVTVVLGASAAHADSVKMKASTSVIDVHVLQNVNNMAELMKDTDLCIGAAGSTSWERACLGVPSIIFSLADNQKQIAVDLDKHKIAKQAQLWDAASLLEIVKHLRKAKNLTRLGINAAKLVDGLGAQKVVEHVESYNVKAI
ncbi:UDP-2,4-diacetamido-2,4,6-trideoxy-beta-L-altropyranose hydrolase [Pseudovibrio sp. Ad26]|uniref:UDP-2,4-diacetamido-2,4, 6-trideoxy-beta-L-altropyranose hydrolase n=1 Tax=Pseudovibrio sp. Ad26 TaxID=989410 RepID=UPI0007AE6CB4|nr:UDP-2,4-diacetamido-2,4,6-trideoxy-beta-L-altropyranose hydrolase [Pseudovibrio sp. Ad26]KZL05208.1 UDP-2,4-diacetamido-2,4,6-trideoxy-beta-L-altropyranose hydrolase [Pseudovibrio sp. Ad26]